MGIFDFLRKSDERLEKVFAYDAEDLQRLNDEELDVEFRYLSALFTRTEDMANEILREMESRGMATPEVALASAVTKGDGEEVTEEEEPVEKVDINEPDYVIKHRGKRNPVVMMVGSCLSKLDVARDSVLSGPIAKTLREAFVPHLGVAESEVHYTTIVPEYLEDETGAPREPTQEELERWAPEFQKHVDAVEPAFVVALGKTAANAIEHHEWVPHPRALMIHGDSGEVGRKLSRLSKHVVDALQESTRSVTAEIFKSDDEKRLVYGVVMEPGVEDADGNWSTDEEIEKAAHFYMQNSQKVKKEHMEEMDSVSVVECYTAPTDFTVGDQVITKGSWVLVTKYHDDAEWQRVKESGGGYSFAGRAKIDSGKRL